MRLAYKPRTSNYCPILTVNDYANKKSAMSGFFIYL